MCGKSLLLVFGALVAVMVWIYMSATIFLYAIRERELILDLFEMLTGARLLYGFHQVGGTRYDVPAGWTQKCRETLAVIEQRLHELARHPVHRAIAAPNAPARARKSAAAN